MSNATTGSLRPVSMPRDARPIMKFSGPLAADIERRIAEARRDGRWARPKNVKMDPKDPESLAYWLSKSIEPIELPMAGHGLEEHFAPFRQTRFELAPSDFEAEREWTMSLSGDLMCTSGLDRARDRLYADVADVIFGADIAFANLESTLTESAVGPTEFTAESTPKINLTPQQYETVISHRGRRYDIVQLANNHILDCGDEGVRATLARLQADGIEQVGVNESAEEHGRPQVRELHGLRIGWVSHTFSVNFKPFPPDKPWRVNMTPFHLVPEPDITGIEAQIRAARAQGCDLVIVALHWGLEFELYPHPDQIKWAHRFAAAGADFVVGHHPHVPQPIEIHRPANDPSRSVPILYSLGNLSTLLSHPAMVLSLVARLRIAQGTLAGLRCTRVVGLELVPVALVAEDLDGEESLRLMPVARLDRRPHDARMASYVDDICRLSDAVVGSGWRNRPD